MSDKPRRERGANYTSEEKALLTELVLKYRHIIEDKRSGGMFLKKKKETWQLIAMAFNSRCTTGSRGLEQLKALYDNMKQKAKKYGGESIMQIEKTEAGLFIPVATDNKNMMTMVKAKVEPLDNPYDSDSVYFNDSNSHHSQEIRDQSTSPVLPRRDSEHENTIDNPIQVEVELVEEGANHSAPSQRITWTKNKCFSRNGRTNVKKMSPEYLKRLYFKKKCENAHLEKRKFIQEMLQNNQQHKLKMQILRKKLEQMDG